MRSVILSDPASEGIIDDSVSKSATKSIPAAEVGEPSERPAGGNRVSWASQYRGPRFAVSDRFIAWPILSSSCPLAWCDQIFGHDAAAMLQTERWALGLDTGACYGNALSAVVLPDWRVVSVAAEAQYTVPKGPAKMDVLRPEWKVADGVFEHSPFAALQG